MYYLQTRWYDPEVGRFVNLDQIEYLNPETANGLNLYAYCQNNPVMYTDPTGTSILGLIGIIIGIIASGIVAGTIYGTVEAIENNTDVEEGAKKGSVAGIGLGVSTLEILGGVFLISKKSNWGGMFLFDVGIGSFYRMIEEMDNENGRFDLSYIKNGEWD